MKYGRHNDGRLCGPIDPARVAEQGWTWYDSAEERDAANPPSLGEVKANKHAQIRRAYEAEAQAIKAGYPATEVLSWDKQEREARAYQADATAATPFLDALATAREMDKAELVGRIMAKVQAADSYIGTITGKRQKLEGLINDAQTVAELDAISWSEA